MTLAADAIMRLKAGNQRYAEGKTVNAVVDAETRRSWPCHAESTQ